MRLRGTTPWPWPPGSSPPADAIAAGRVRVRGDLSVLAEAQAVLASVSVPARRSPRRHGVLTRGAPGCTGGPRTTVGR